MPKRSSAPHASKDAGAGAKPISAFDNLTDLVGLLARRIVAAEKRIIALEERAATAEGRVAALEGKKSK